MHLHSHIFLSSQQQGGWKYSPSTWNQARRPLSPYIFILCGEVLSGLCKKAQETDIQRCTNLMVILKGYEVASGQKINALKSSISFSAKTPPEVRARVKIQLGIEKEGGVGKYLGLPEHFGRKKKDLFASIVDHMKQKALSWNTRFLSTAGKATMLQSVLSPVPTFAMTCFQLPVGLCNQLQSVLTRFWWDAKEGESKICWIAWDTLMLPKHLGGLGFRDIRLFNQALIAKIAWRLILKPECLLSRILLGKYCHNASFLKVAHAASSSHGWKGILWGQRASVGSSR
ncbi:hypothetical protein YC2023_113450 [Brassica napus]